jgi:hypothetical protein
LVFRAFLFCDELAKNQACAPIVTSYRSVHPPGDAKKERQRAPRRVRTEENLLSFFTSKKQKTASDPAHGYKNPGATCTHIKKAKYHEQASKVALKCHFCKLKLCF